MKFKTTPEERKVFDETISVSSLVGPVARDFVRSMVLDLDAAQARIAELERERDEWERSWLVEQARLEKAERERDDYKRMYDNREQTREKLVHEFAESVARASRAEAKAAELEKALQIAREMLAETLHSLPDGKTKQDVYAALAASRAEEGEKSK